MLKGKCVVLGVTGSIAAYKIAYLASALVKQHADVHVIMTENATNFINPITFETLTSNKCLIDTFDRNFQFNVEHVALAKRADIFMVAPASANVIGKMANGINRQGKEVLQHPAFQRPPVRPRHPSRLPLRCQLPLCSISVCPS